MKNLPLMAPNPPHHRSRKISICVTFGSFRGEHLYLELDAGRPVPRNPGGREGGEASLSGESYEGRRGSILLDEV